MQFSQNSIGVKVHKANPIGLLKFKWVCGRRWGWRIEDTRRNNQGTGLYCCPHECLLIKAPYLVV